MVKRVILSFFFLCNISWGVDPDLLKIEAKIYPKIVELDRELSKKLLDHQITFSILYDEQSTDDAIYLKTILEENGYRAKIELEPTKPLATAYILAKKPSKELFQKLLHTRRIIFAINFSMLPYSTIGLYIGVRIKPYLNVKVLKMSQISLNPIIFRVAKLYE